MLWWVCSFHASTCISHPQLVTANHSSSSMKACRMYALHIYRIYTWSFCFESLTRTMQEMLWAALLEPAVWGDDESPKPVENAPDCCSRCRFRFAILNDSEKWQELRGKLGTSFGLLHNEAPLRFRLLIGNCWLRVVWWPGDPRSQQHCGTLLCSVCTGVFQENLRVNSMPAFNIFNWWCQAEELAGLAPPEVRSCQSSRWNTLRNLPGWQEFDGPPAVILQFFVRPWNPNTESNKHEWTYFLAVSICGKFADLSRLIGSLMKSLV